MKMIWPPDPGTLLFYVEFGLFFLQLGILIGNFLGKKSVRGTFDGIVQDFRSQKKDMWNEYKKTKGGI